MAKIVKQKLQSKLLQREICFQVVLPKSYKNSVNRLPILFLLHGLFGSCENWSELTNIRYYASKSDLIIVLVEGENSWYLDSRIIEKNKFESYFIQELIPYIEKKFRIENGHRAVAGLSMGGYGAIKYALKNPTLFIFAGSMSGAFIAPRLFKENCSQDFEELLPSIEQVFGKTENQTRIKNDLFRIIEKLPTESIERLPYFYMDCGTDDVFLETNRTLVDLFKKRNIRFEYHEESGGHDWDYWNKQLEKILEIVGRKIGT